MIGAVDPIRQGSLSEHRYAAPSSELGGACWLLSRMVARPGGRAGEGAIQQAPPIRGDGPNPNKGGSLMPKRTRRQLTGEEREQRRAQQRELVKASVEQLRSSEGWRAYLRARRTFHSYTPATSF
jgi:hypothetical protein